MTEQRQIIHVVDDDEAMRDSMTWLLEGEGYQVACFDSAETFLKAYRRDMRGCLVLDVRMPEMSGLELHEKLDAWARNCRSSSSPATATCRWPSAPCSAGPAISSKSPSTTKTCCHASSAPSNSTARSTPAASATRAISHRLEQLTQREREVMDLVVAGKLNKQIADELNISMKTVEAHRARVMEKMGVRTLAELVKVVLTVN
jgi:two-component system response regulator TtrR